IELTDRPDAGLSYVSSNLPAGVSFLGNDQLLVSSLAQGTSISFEVTYQISPTFQGTSLTNVAEITEDDGDDIDSTPNNDDPTDDDQDEETIPVNQVYHLALTKSLTNAGPFSQGDTVTNTISIISLHGAHAIYIELTDRPDAGL